MYLIIPGTLIALMGATIFMLPLDCSERVTVGKKCQHSLFELKRYSLCSTMQSL